jgi:phytoene synthase
LFAIEDAMADVVVRSTQPALAAIKLAWWRERLEELDAGKVPAEPRLKAVATELLPRGIGGAELAGLEEGWAGLLYDPPEIGLVTEHGARLFAIGARLLGVDFQYETIGVAGSLFAKMDAARRGLIASAAPVAGRASMRIPRRARALTGLAALATRDLRRAGPPFEAEATPGRAWTLLRHRLTGRL